MAGEGSQFAADNASGGASGAAPADATTTPPALGPESPSDVFDGLMQGFAGISGDPNVEDWLRPPDKGDPPHHLTFEDPPPPDKPLPPPVHFGTGEPDDVIPINGDSSAQGPPEVM